MMWSPRHGQWVSFTTAAPIPFAHATPDGRVVGIYQKGGFAHAPLVAKPGDDPRTVARANAPVYQPPRVAVVNAAGENCPHIDPKGRLLSDRLEIPVADLLDLQPVLGRDHVPADRLATAHPDWHPRA